MNVACYSFRLLVCFLTLTTGYLSAHAQGPETETASAKEILSGMSPGQKLYTLRKFRFIDQVLNGISWTDIAINRDIPVSRFQETSPYADSTFQGQPGLSRDPMAAEIARRYLDVPPTISLNNLFESIASSIRESRRKHVRRNLPVPSATEVDVLRIMWDQAFATSSEIYGLMDSLAIARVTSEDIRHTLEEMTEKGLLERKQISASHNFSVFGVWKFEMNPNNVRNREYLYWPTVSREALIAYLDVKRFWALAEKDGSGHESRIELEQRLHQIVK
jgi:hypothetical protein